ncbi:hypothetical protein NEF87_001612 [Candidatus Lokiarchaeum ossiferum]|uniref:Methyltransferase type 11 domain-containing protein n=1 Tax=Candidatus Lokiarchaeum ossiferum TaxID=2951803 RepID=A0ABY6HR21_9ARCH|nr:hypothetical protein NEF87_001612 [Candidatus Lokiarchaeum sp. B-35]
MDLKKYTEMNKEAWNEVQPIHQEGRKIDLKVAVKDPNFNTLAKEELEGFTKIGFKGKEIVHVCCNNGIELLSLVKLGAKRGVGYDISDKFIAEANQYANIAQVDCKYVQADAYDLTPKEHGLFDILYLSVGALCWMPDLKLFFEKCASLIKPSGHIFIFDSHPVTSMIGFEGEEGYNPEYPLNPINSYFKDDPWIETDGIDYIGGTEYKSKPMASFAYKMGDIINNLINADIEIMELNEYAEDIATVYGHVKDFKIYPLCFSLIGKKKE